MQPVPSFKATPQDSSPPSVVRKRCLLRSNREPPLRTLLHHCNDPWEGRQVFGNDRYLPPQRSGGGEGRHPTACMRDIMREIGGLGEPIQFLGLLFYFQRYFTTAEGKCQGFFGTKVLVFLLRIFVGCVVECAMGYSIG